MATRASCGIISFSIDRYLLVMVVGKDREPSHVAARSCHARNESAADWIGYGHKHDRNCPGSFHQRRHDWGAVAENAVGLKLGEIFGECPHSVGVATCKAILDPWALADRPARRFQPSFESRNAGLGLHIIRESQQNTDRVRASCLLCIGRNRPADQCTTEHSYKFASSNINCHPFPRGSAKRISSLRLEMYNSGRD